MGNDNNMSAPAGWYPLPTATCGTGTASSGPATSPVPGQGSIHRRGDAQRRLRLSCRTRAEPRGSRRSRELVRLGRVVPRGTPGRCGCGRRRLLRAVRDVRVRGRASSRSSAGASAGLGSAPGQLGVAFGVAMAFTFVGAATADAPETPVAALTHSQAPSPPLARTPASTSPSATPTPSVTPSPSPTKSAVTPANATKGTALAAVGQLAVKGRAPGRGTHETYSARPGSTPTATAAIPATTCCAGTSWTGT